METQSGVFAQWKWVVARCAEEQIPHALLRAGTAHKKRIRDDS
jgi:hypothetical protein